ncbi:hypothetical protein DPMN_168838 [Dreissena polymorpha]|uniref:Uncharacterized protein n=1 Tax=Dreissena polymorpha TaxID=45954 RepID=A0A9D4F445_DREPO|nr:hypothetical protein DPMN_168838 [Dreissena polymorpha]
MLMAHDGQRTTDKKQSQKLIMSTLCSGELKREVSEDAERRVKEIQMELSQKNDKRWTGKKTTYH